MVEKTPNDRDLISIITICFNAEQNIAKTMESVLNQTYHNIEYIIKDGKSLDRTNEIIEQYKEKFEKKGIRFLHIIQEDQGIYDAMNQAINSITGQYVIYMNADDIFFDNYVLESIFSNQNHESDILYGDSVCEYEFIKGKKEYTLWQGQHYSFSTMPFSHQACFVRAELMKQYQYDLRFSSASDYHLLARFLVDGRSFCNICRIVALCTMNGISNIEIQRSYKETVQVKQELNMEEFLSKDTQFNMWLMEIKQWILKTLPHAFVGQLLRLQMRRKGKRIYKNLEDIQSN